MVQITAAVEFVTRCRMLAARDAAPVFSPTAPDCRFDVRGFRATARSLPPTGPRLCNDNFANGSS